MSQILTQILCGENQYLERSMGLLFLIAESENLPERFDFNQFSGREFRFVSYGEVFKIYHTNYETHEIALLM